MIPTIGDSLIQTAIIPTRTSERQLRRIIKRRGGPSMPFVQTELACYIRFRECSGRTLDTGGQMLRFDDHICLLIGKFQGVWHILSIWWDAEVVPPPGIVPSGELVQMVQ